MNTGRNVNRWHHQTENPISAQKGSRSIHKSQESIVISEGPRKSHNPAAKRAHNTSLQANLKDVERQISKEQQSTTNAKTTIKGRVGPNKLVTSVPMPRRNTRNMRVAITTFDTQPSHREPALLSVDSIDEDKSVLTI